MDRHCSYYTTKAAESASCSKVNLCPGFIVWMLFFQLAYKKPKYMPHLFEIEEFANLKNTSELVTAREWTQGGEEIEEAPQLLVKLQGAVLKGRT